MTIAYNTGIPAGPHNPSADQPLMLTNTNNIATYVAVDHVAFNTAGSGQHKQVTFNAANPPASDPITPPVLFTNTQDGQANALPGNLAQLFFYTGVAATVEEQYVSLATGSALLMGGIIMKWGTGTFKESPGVGNNFSFAFPNNCFSVVVSPMNTTYQFSISVTFTKTGFTAVRTNGSGTQDLTYIAIGN